jgi:hypothetical protein
MDRELSNIRNALIDTRVSLSHQFQKMTQLIDKEGFGCFLEVYCRQAASLSHWMSEWNERVRQKAAAANEDELAQTFTRISELLFRRHQALDEDTVKVSGWLSLNTSYSFDFSSEKLPVSPGMKQLRFISQECGKRSYYVSWLLIMTEIERLRIVHGFTLIKLCELYFGPSILRCFSHIHYQHQNQNELFTVCENALLAHIKLHTASVQSMIAQVKSAIDAYACFIDDCYKISMQRVAQDVKAVHK